MDAKVKAMIKLIEEDADSFARRTEMYYKKRPELMKLVKEFYRAYRFLAKRYDHTTGELRQANRTMTEAFPNQVPFVLFDNSPSGSSAHEREPHTPEMPHRCLNSVVLIETSKLKSVEEKCVLLETSNQSLRLEVENLVKKIAMKDQQLSKKHEELEDEQLRFVQVEATLQTLRNLHFQSQ
ncbi:hypothetical protein ACSBR1_031670 [Camellia fascicularis]